MRDCAKIGDTDVTLCKSESSISEPYTDVKINDRSSKDGYFELIFS